MKTEEKLEILKETIRQLYSKEGRSFSYISKLLEVNRKKLTDFIKANKFEEPIPRRHLTPSNQKFANRNRMYIKSQLDSDVDTTIIAKNLGVSSNYLLYTVIRCDDVLRKSLDEKNSRIHKRHSEKQEELLHNSQLNYSFNEIVGEEWKPVKGYDKYSVSNMGRVRKQAQRYGVYFLLRQQPNKNNGRLYARIVDDNGVSHNLQVSRLVGYNFVVGHSDDKNTINHIDGDVSNNRSDNLEWVSQSENNFHAYKCLNRTHVNFRRYNFDRILYKGKYEFKTVAAFARFIGKSETQTRRYLDNPEQYEIELVTNCND